MPDAHHLTELLHAWRGGDTAAANELINHVYDELRRIAVRQMQLERREHTLQATALVHELYVRLFASEKIDWEDRAHFFAVAARQLRRILVNHARDRRAGKRGGGRIRLSLADADIAVRPVDHDLLAIDESLHKLEQLDPRSARVVELRYFAGLQEKEAAAVLGMSVATLKRDWEFARAWLLTQMTAEPGRTPQG
jgi:RNA polymerase sigma factor (TIGR02999 family)